MADGGGSAQPTQGNQFTRRPVASGFIQSSSEPRPTQSSPPRGKLHGGVSSVPSTALPEHNNPRYNPASSSASQSSTGYQYQPNEYQQPTAPYPTQSKAKPAHGGARASGNSAPMQTDQTSRAPSYHSQQQPDVQPPYQSNNIPLQEYPRNGQMPNTNVPATGSGPSGTPNAQENVQSNIPPSQANFDQSAQRTQIWQPTRERGHLNIEQSVPKLKYPHLYQDWRMIPSGEEVKHFDTLGRRYKGKSDYRYISSWDGKIRKMVVQCTQDIYNENHKASGENSDLAAVPWRRTFIRHSSPWLMRLSNWTLKTMNQQEDRTAGQLVWLGFKWIVCVCALFFVILIPVEATGEVRNNGNYDALPHKFWGYSYQARNIEEDQDRHIKGGSQSTSNSSLRRHEQLTRGMLGSLNRLNRPNYLCYLRDGGRAQRVPENSHDRYIFVSWTTAHFNPDESVADRNFLHFVGATVARQRGLPAYWLSCDCLGTGEQEIEENVWTICDVMRSADAMILVVGDTEPQNLDMRIREWANRVWTLPELLLCPGDDEIRIFSRGASDFNFEEAPTRPRRTLPVTLHPEKETAVKALIDHFEGGVILGPLELTTIALKCLYASGKPDYLNGDLTYALMGLLRQRPPVNREDTAFQAFARLSLANDSNQLLERLICTLPKWPNQPWHNMDDSWGAVLWDIYPTTQICGVGHNDTIIIDGAKAASVRWKSFASVAQAKRNNWKRFLTRMFLRSSGYTFWAGIGFASNGAATGSTAFKAIGVLLLIYSLLWLLPAPYLFRVLYGGKIWGAQPWFFGFEGYLDINTIERMVFGIESGALSWSAAGSPLSWHWADEDSRCIGRDPIDKPGVRERIEKAIKSRMGEEKIFTLVDTYTLTVTLFAAVRPPTAVVICGEEGGMKRALMCSYDWPTQTLYRETVLRMETPVYEKMDAVGRIKLGLTRVSGLGGMPTAPAA